MKLFDIIKDANQNLLRNKLRSFLTILAIFIGSFSIISTSAIQAGVNDFIDSQVASYGGEGYLAIASRDSFEALEGIKGASNGPIEYKEEKVQTSATPIDKETIEKLKQIEGIDPDSIQETKSVDITYVASDRTDKRYLIGAEALPPGNVKVDTVTGTNVNNSEDRYQIVLQNDYVDALGYDEDSIIGKKIKLVYVDQFTQLKTEFEAEVVGVIAPGVVSLGYSYINEKLANDIYDINTANYPEEYKNLVYGVTASYDYENYDIKDIREDLKEINLTAITLEDIIGTIKSFFDVILTVFRIFGFIALIAAAIGIINTLFMSVQERTREIGLDKALGMSSSRVFISFSLEAVMLGFWGSVFGVVCSMIIGNIANVSFHAEGGFLEAFPTFNLAVYTWPDIITVTILIMAIAFLAGTLPARQAAHKNPIDSLRYE